MYTVTRYHDISCGHRVHGHESKCRHLHGHNYRIWFTCIPNDGELDGLGRVVDFGIIKLLLCEWLERNWDHKFLVDTRDPLYHHLNAIAPDSVVSVSFNPTAENMAAYLVEYVGPQFLRGTGVTLHSVRVDETRKCSATYTLHGESISSQ